jgi:hypothetical protein
VSPPSAPDGGGWPASGDAQGWSAPTNRGGWPARPQSSDEGWGPSTAVYSGATTNGAPPATGTRATTRVGRAFTTPPAAPTRSSDDWSPAGPTSARDQRATRKAERRTEEAVQAVGARRAQERGLPWWAALLVLIVIAAAGGVIDTLGSIQVKGGFNIGIVVASIVAILVVKRSHMFPIVIAPPIVYSAAAIFQLYVRSSGLDDKKVVLDAAANYLVYGFPAIAAATAAVLIIAGIRMISRK